MSIVTFDTELPIHASPCERPLLQAMVRYLVHNSGQYSVSVWDGEEYSIKKSTNGDDILNAMSHTGEDHLEIYDRDSGKDLGWFWLIYSNGSEHEPMVVISDYSANEYCENVYRKLDEAFGGYEL